MKEKPLYEKIELRLREMQDKNIKRVYIPNGDFRRLEEDIKTAVKKLKEEIDKWVKDKDVDGRTIKYEFWDSDFQDLRDIFKEILGEEKE